MTQKQLAGYTYFSLGQISAWLLGTILQFFFSANLQAHSPC